MGKLHGVGWLVGHHIPCVGMDRWWSRRSGPVGLRREDPARLRARDRGCQPALWPPADFVYLAQVTVYARALGIALAQKANDTDEASERAAL